MDPYIGQIMMFGGNFPIRAWAFCDGQLLSISQNSALFSILGTVYGGDGRTTFGLPDLRGRAAIHPGDGPGLSGYRQGEKGGAETETLLVQQIPSHTHFDVLKVSSAPATESVPTTNSSIAAPGVSDGRTTTPTFGFGNSAPNVSLNGGSVVGGHTGGGLDHNNLQPFLAVYHLIALFGVYPSRS